MCSSWSEGRRSFGGSCRPSSEASDDALAIIADGLTFEDEVDERPGDHKEQEQDERVDPCLEFRPLTGKMHGLLVVILLDAIIAPSGAKPPLRF